MSRDWEHGALQRDLARAKREAGEIVGQDVSLGTFGVGGRMDLLTARPSWTDWAPTCYEVKANRSDFLSDARRGKFRRYLDWSERLYFAAPAGMVKKAEVPEGVGLLVRGENGWHGVVAPRLSRLEPEQKELVARALMMNALDSPWSPRSKRMSRAERIRELVETEDLEDKRHLLADRVSEALARKRELERVYERAARTLLKGLGRDPDEYEAPVVDRRRHTISPQLREGTDVRDLARALVDREVPQALLRKAVERGENAVKASQIRLRREADNLERHAESLRQLGEQVEDETD